MRAESPPRVLTEVDFPHGNKMEIDASMLAAQKCLKRLSTRNIKVIVFDMDHTMSSRHCGTGQPLTHLKDYIDHVSKDFITLANLAYSEGFKLAVATNSDRLEYDVDGNSRSTHICAEDLATELIKTHLPHTLPAFEIMVGYDYRLHGKDEKNRGKRYHMRQIAAHYGVEEMSEMVLLDDSRRNLKNQISLLVQDANVGFQFSDILDSEG